jgi:hypothetical protein
MPISACPGFFEGATMGRREFLRAGAVPLVGLGLPQLLHARASAQAAAVKAKAKACILLFM